jgi:thymidine kinase
MEEAEAGEIQVIYGPMFSGKSTELLRRIRRYTAARKACVVLKYQRDVRYSAENMSTHDSTSCEAHPCLTLTDASNLVEKVDVIGVDEGQFFPDIVTFCERMANQGKIVIVAALDGTFQREPFGTILGLLPLAESVTKLNAVCQYCNKEAAFTKRLGSETEIEIIGGSESYVAVCRHCFFHAH